MALNLLDLDQFQSSRNEIEFICSVYDHKGMIYLYNITFYFEAAFTFYVKLYLFCKALKLGILKDLFLKYTMKIKTIFITFHCDLILYKN